MRELLAEKLFAEAEANLQVGNTRQAAALLKKVLRYEPGHVLACGHLLTYHETRREYAEAARYLRRLIETLGPEPHAFFDLARLLSLAGDTEGACAAYEVVVAAVGDGRSAGLRELKRFAEWEIAALRSRLARRQEERAAQKSTERKLSTKSHRSKKPTPNLGPAAHPGSGGRRQELSAPASPQVCSPAHPATPEGPPKPAAVPEPIPIRTSIIDPKWEFLAGAGTGDLVTLSLRLDFHRLTLLRDYDDLLCLPSLRGVEHFEYQTETVKKVVRDFGGRVLLADEVGLGKTIEAGMVAKELLLRGLARSVLVLTPPSLVTQWKEEMESKFGLAFDTTDDTGAAAQPSFWKGERLIASLSLARSKAHFPHVTARPYDILIVDEAHRLKNRGTLSWKLVNAIEKKYVLLLTATPVENNLIELYNLITLLKPGALKTEAEFRREYTRRGDPREPARPEKLRGLLSGVMIRNTRSLVDLKLPKRFATTLLVEPSPPEREIYEAVSEIVRQRSRNDHPARERLLLSTLLREAGSSASALKGTLSADLTDQAQLLVSRIDSLGETAKGKRLVQLLQQKPGEKVVIFTQFRGSLVDLAGLLSRYAIPYATYHGGLAAERKEDAIRRFREEVPILLATECGGEGHNLQFANTLVNFDLPWNPMRIEQRIGRLHRIGQTRDVFVFNLAVAGTLEHQLLEILDRKINLFELVVGEVGMILGHWEEEADFDEVVFDLWRSAGSDAQAKALFEELGEKLAAARGRYREAQTLDEMLFRQEFEA